MGIVLTALLACTSTAVLLGPVTSGPSGTTTEPRTSNGGTTDGAQDNVVPVELTGLSASLHDTVGSIVVVDWVQSGVADLALSFSVDPGVWQTTPTRGLAKGAHQEWIVGVPYGANVTWRVVATGGFGTVESPEHDIETAAAPEGLPIGEVLVSDAWDPAFPYVLASTQVAGGDFGDVWFAQILDRSGRVVWSWESDREHIIMHPRLSYDGLALLIDANSYWGLFDGGDDSSVSRMTLDGNVEHTWVTPGLHHPFTELPGNILSYGAAEFPYRNEFIIEVDVAATQRIVFDCEAWLDDVNTNEYCGSNTLNWRESSNSYLFSFYSMDSILDIDAASGAVTRAFGQVKTAYAFEPEDTTFWWQHGGNWTPEGTLITSTYDAEEGRETIVREYEVDDANETLVELRSFGLGSGLFGEEMGEVTRMASGHTMHNTGTLPRIREYDVDGAVVWDFGWPDGDVGRTTPLASLYVLLPDRL